MALQKATTTSHGFSAPSAYYRVEGVGIVTAGGSIGGLPFASNASQGAGAYGGNSDTTGNLQGTIGQSASSITNIPARTLTGNTWQITATYFTT